MDSPPAVLSEPSTIDEDTTFAQAPGSSPSHPSQSSFTLGVSGLFPTKPCSLPIPQVQNAGTCSAPISAPVSGRFARSSTESSPRHVPMATFRLLLSDSVVPQKVCEHYATTESPGCQGSAFSPNAELASSASGARGFGSIMESAVSRVSSISQIGRIFGRRISNPGACDSPSGQSFRKCKSLKLAAEASFVRASPLTSVMQSGGLVLKPGFQKFGSAELYQRSKEVPRIQDFISHSWRDGRWSKFVSLCLLYNGTAGLVASLIYCAVVLVVQRTAGIRFGWGTYKKVLAGQEHMMNEGGCLAFLGAPIVCLFFLYNWIRIRGLWEGIPNVFLDRLCIHQTDEDLKRRGILSIGGILKHSDRMVVLWSPAYFFRLWCMFEVAVWCHLDRMEKLVLVPLSKAVLVVAGASGVYVGCMVNLFVHRLGHWETSTLLSIVMVLAPPAVHCLRALMRDMVALRHQLGNVSVTAAECFCCSVNHVCPETKKEIQCDRELILNTVKELYASMGQSEEFAAEKFDNKVRKDFAQRIIQNIGGPDAMPMRWCLLIVAPMMWRSADVVSARDLPSAAILRLVLERFTYVLETLLVVRVCFFACGYLAVHRGLFVVDYAVSCLGAWACLALAIALFAKTYIASMLSVVWPLAVNIFVSSMINLAICWSEFPPRSDKRKHAAGAFRYLWNHRRNSRTRISRGGSSQDINNFTSIAVNRISEESRGDLECKPCRHGKSSSQDPCDPSPWGLPPATSAGESATVNAKNHLGPPTTATARRPSKRNPESQHFPVVTSWDAAKENEEANAAMRSYTSWGMFSPSSSFSGDG